MAWMHFTTSWESNTNSTITAAIQIETYPIHNNTRSDDDEDGDSNNDSHTNNHHHNHNNQ